MHKQTNKPWVLCGDKMETLDELMKQFKWHWSLEKCSEGEPHEVWDRWLVWNENGDVIADATTPQEAAYNALNNPLTEAQSKYSPRWRG